MSIQSSKRDLLRNAVKFFTFSHKDQFSNLFEISYLVESQRKRKTILHQVKSFMSIWRI